MCALKVSSLFKDGTIGGNINIVIVGLVLLDEEQVRISKLMNTVRLFKHTKGKQNTKTAGQRSCI